jgi:protocatechuate 3,4-dioxygenase, alpha subunit
MGRGGGAGASTARGGGAGASTAVTPSQTVGPFLAIGLPWPDGPFVVPEGTAGAITITGVVTDGAGEPVPDALVETWQAGPDGRFSHPGDPRGAPGEPGPAFRGFGRCPTGPDGSYRIVTLKPGALPSPGGGTEAPHLDVSVFARGLLDRVVTRIYFPDETAANDADPVLASIADPARAATLVARADPDVAGQLRFDIRLQGDGETVFFDV